MRTFQEMTIIRTRTYRKIFKSVLAYLSKTTQNRVKKLRAAYIWTEKAL